MVVIQQRNVGHVSKGTKALWSSPWSKPWSQFNGRNRWRRSNPRRVAGHGTGPISRPGATASQSQMCLQAPCFCLQKPIWLLQTFAQFAIIQYPCQKLVLCSAAARFFRGLEAVYSGKDVTGHNQNGDGGGATLKAKFACAHGLATSLDRHPLSTVPKGQHGR